MAFGKLLVTVLTACFASQKILLTWQKKLRVLLTLHKKPKRWLIVYKKKFLKILRLLKWSENTKVCMKSMPNKKIKILHIMPRFATGGAERMVLHYARLLDIDKFEV